MDLKPIMRQARYAASHSSTAVGSFERTLDTALHDAGTGPTAFSLLLR